MTGKGQSSPPASKHNTPQQSASESDNDIKKQHIPSESSENRPTQKLTVRQQKRRRPNDDVEQKCECTSMRDEIRKMMSEMMSKQDDRMDRIENRIKDLKLQSGNDTKDIKTRVDQVQSSNTHIESSISFLSDQIKIFESKIDGLDAQRKVMEQQVQILDDKLENMERFSLKTAIEIRNVPKVLKETKDNLLLILHTLSKSLNITVQNHELKDMYRLPVKRDSMLSTIVVEFANTWSKSNFLRAVKQYRKSRSDQLNSKNLGFVDQSVPVYISERLTAKAKRLYFLAREFAKSEEFAHCWIANGKVFLRKKDGEPFVVVKNEERLHSLRIRSQHSTMQTV